MSYNAKNLAYEAKEPAFLQKLRGQYGNTSGGLERPVAQRPRKPRENDDDDQPTYVDEESNEIISKEEYEALLEGTSVDQSGPSGQGTMDGQPIAQSSEGHTKNSGKEGFTSKQNLAEIGGPRKRKQAKIIGDDTPIAENKDEEPKKSGSQKPKQKKKKIKLSFEE